MRGADHRSRGPAPPGRPPRSGSTWAAWHLRRRRRRPGKCSRGANLHPVLGSAAHHLDIKPNWFLFVLRLSEWEGPPEPWKLWEILGETIWGASFRNGDSPFFFLLSLGFAWFCVCVCIQTWLPKLVRHFNENLNGWVRVCKISTWSGSLIDCVDSMYVLLICRWLDIWAYSEGQPF